MAIYTGAVQENKTGEDEGAGKGGGGEVKCKEITTLKKLRSVRWLVLHLKPKSSSRELYNPARLGSS